MSDAPDALLAAAMDLLQRQLADDPRQPASAGNALAQQPRQSSSTHTPQPLPAALCRIAPDQPLRPGDTGYVAVPLAGDRQPPAADAVGVTDLLGPPGHAIPSAHIRVGSYPVSESLYLEVRVPTDAAPGVYAGLLLYPRTRWLLEVTVQ